MGTRTHTEHTDRDTFQGYPQILNKVGDKITLKLKDVDGSPYTQTAEIIAFYKTFVLLNVCNKYRVTIHNTEFGNYKGAKAQRCSGLKFRITEVWEMIKAAAIIVIVYILVLAILNVSDE